MTPRPKRASTYWSAWSRRRACFSNSRSASLIRRTSSSEWAIRGDNSTALRRSLVVCSAGRGWPIKEQREVAIALGREHVEVRRGDRIARRHVAVLDHRVHIAAVPLQTIVKMHPGREPRHADAADLLTLADTLAGAHGDRRQVQVFRFVSIRMPHFHRAATTIAPPGHRHDARRDGADRRSGRSIVIDAVMSARVAKDGVFARA